MMKEMESSQKEDGLSGEVSMEGKKSCAVCKTTKTPLWRSGPSGPKSLCNACGIRHRKKQPISPEEEDPDVIASKKCKIVKKKRKPMVTSGLGVNLKRLKSPRRQWGEVERAALLLMALSCGAVFA